MNLAALRAVTGRVFTIDETATHDGPGVRMVVYLKGCPLRCVWCHSPESQRAEAEMAWYEARCVRCGACVEACPNGVRSLNGERGESACRLCGLCVAACEHDALEIVGREVTAGEVMDRAVRHRRFYHHGRGGVTLSGGEPARQSDFAYAVLALLHEAGLNTALETSGFVDWAVLARLATVADLFLFDLKHADAELHRRDTGVSNERILDNLARLLALGSEVLVRVPCIPGRNGTPEIISAIAAAVVERGGRRLSLLPYNPAAPGKYAWLDREFPLAGTQPHSAAEFQALRDAAEATGIEVVEP